jgi:hypothetical protein
MGPDCQSNDRTVLRQMARNSAVHTDQNRSLAALWTVKRLTQRLTMAGVPTQHPSQSATLVNARSNAKRWCSVRQKDLLCSPQRVLLTHGSTLYR